MRSVLPLLRVRDVVLGHARGRPVHDAALEDPGRDLRAAVAERLLHSAQVDARLAQDGGVRVSQRAWIRAGVRHGYCRSLGSRRRVPCSRHRRLTAVRKQRKQRDRGNGHDPDQDQVGEMQPAVPVRPSFAHVSRSLPQSGGLVFTATPFHGHSPAYADSTGVRSARVLDRPGCPRGTGFYSSRRRIRIGRWEARGRAVARSAPATTTPRLVLVCERPRAGERAAHPRLRRQRAISAICSRRTRAASQPM